MSTKIPIPMEQLYALRLRSIWASISREHFAFWAICGYLFVEYVRPQSILPWLDVLPWAQLFLLMAAVGWVATKERKWVKDPVNKWLTLFSIVIALACATATYPEQSWPRYFWYFQWYLIYFLIINLVTSERRFLFFLVVFLLASFKLSFFGARTWALRGFGFTHWGLMGPPGYFENSGEYAMQMLMFAPIAFELAMFLKPRVSLLTFLILMLMPITAAMSVMGASSRGAQIAMVYQAYRNLIKGKLSVRSLIVVGAVIWAVITFLPEAQKERFRVAGDDRTSQQRLLYWEHGWDMMKEHPLLGVGYFNFPQYYADNYPEDMLYETAQLPHNIFIQVGTDAGFTGLFLFGMILYRNFKSARDVQRLAREHGDEKERPFAGLAKGLAVAAWGFIIAGQFVTVAYYPFIWINLAMTVALHNIAVNHYRRQAGEKV